MYCGDCDSAQIAYTSRFVDFAIEAAEYWWECVVGLDWYQLNVGQNLGTPMVGVKLDFEAPLIAGDRVDLIVTLGRLGRSSLSLRVEGMRLDGRRSFVAELTSALIDREAMKSTPFGQEFRGRIEGYGRECALREAGVASIDEINDFWFGAPGTPERGGNRGVWFRNDKNVNPDQFDGEIQDKFLATYEAIGAGKLQHWAETAEGAIALILVLDQFSRNMFRDDLRAFAADGQALAYAAEAIERGFDAQVSPVARSFFYLPYEHSEKLADQDRALELFGRLAGTEDGDRNIDYAKRHHVVIARFGRFPHRNIILGRQSTAAENAFLEEQGSGF